MDALKNECWFHCELAAPTSPYVNVRDLEAYIERGRATTSAVELSGTNRVVSVSVKDASQGDVKGLPCGARSLLLEADTGAIVCRGINKFFDISEVSGTWLGDPGLWAGTVYRVWAVRKMAGFVVTVFSLDGHRLEVMSKHVLAGPHVNAARQLLEMLNDEQRLQMASDLFECGACASFECIRRAVDYQHPVLEGDEFDEQLVLIAVQKRAQLREQSLSFAAMPTIATKWGVKSVPGVALTDRSALQDVLKAVEEWNSVYSPFTECPVLAEGFVLLIEVTPDNEETKRDLKDAFSWCYPIRLKLKAPRYVVLRAFRSLVMGDSRPPTYPYHHGLLGWFNLSPNVSVEQLRTRLTDAGVSRFSAAFEAAIETTARVRYRDAVYTVGQALVHLQTVSARSANPRSHCPLTLLVLCGLPGAGKTTLSKALLKSLTADASPSSPFKFVVYVSRDSVTREVALRHGVDDSSSKHKQRRLRALVHDALCDQMRDVARLCHETQERGLLIFDGCNATQASRQVWRRCVPASLDGYQILYVDCADAAISAQRSGHRDGHEVLRNASEAQHALYTVRKKFQPPTPEECCWYVDTNTRTVAEAVNAVQGRLVQLLEYRLESGTSGSIKEISTFTAGAPLALSMTFVRAELRQRRATLLYSLLGLPESAAAQLEDITTFLSTENRRPIRAPSLRVRLSCTMEMLREMVAQVLSPSLCPPYVETSALPTSISLAAAGRRFLSRVSSALWGNKSLTSCTTTTAAKVITGTVVRGHLKWLRGWLFRGREPTALPDITKTLQDRFEKDTATPHVTLLHNNGDVTGSHIGDGSVQKYLNSVGLRLGDEVAVYLKTLLIDRHAICFGVVFGSDGRHTVQGISSSNDLGVHEGVPLHITVATVEGTAAAYAGQMFETFAAWQSDNELLLARQQAPQPVLNRSQCKYHNFVEFRLDSAVELKGVVELHSQ